MGMVPRLCRRERQMEVKRTGAAQGPPADRTSRYCFFAKSINSLKRSTAAKFRSFATLLKKIRRKPLCIVGTETQGATRQQLKLSALPPLDGGCTRGFP